MLEVDHTSHFGHTATRSVQNVLETKKHMLLLISRKLVDSNAVQSLLIVNFNRNKSTPYGTDGRLLLTANVKVT